MDRLNRIILSVTNDLNNDQRMQRICSSLADAGYEVLLVGRQKANSKPLRSQKFSQHRIKCHFQVGKRFYLEFNIKLFVFLLRHSFDVACAIDLDTILPVLAASRLKGKRTVFDAHEHFTQVPEVIHRKRIQWVWKQVEAYSVPRMDLCYTVSHSIALYMLESYGKQFEVVLNVPFKRDLERKASDEPYLLYQGALNAGRGLVQLITAMKRIDCRLKLAGEGDLSEELRDLVKLLKLEHKIEFLGMLDPEALRTVTRNAYIGLNLLDGESMNYYYSLANKFFDYIHAAVPAVNMDFPEYRRINAEQQVGVLIEDLSEDSIVEGINLILTDRQLYEEITSNCKEVRNKYNWQIESDKLVNLYRRLD